ncbi:MAG: TetR/AcrR family transcriptional regulator [Gemmatimonadales bacterium]
MPQTSRPEAPGTAGPDLGSGRANQKRRTRKAVIDAANRLLERGVKPTLEDVAEDALVSRATVYRYFPSVEALVADALFEREAPGPEELFAAGPEGLLDRVLKAEAAVNDLLFGEEVAVHVICRMFIDNWLDSQEGDRVPRPARRLPVIDAALEPYADTLGRDTLARLRHALALVMGTESVIALRDVCGLDAADARETTSWAARALVDAALAETKSHGA